MLFGGVLVSGNLRSRSASIFKVLKNGVCHGHTILMTRPECGHN
jgi:hypothetical protein